MCVVYEPPPVLVTEPVGLVAPEQEAAQVCFYRLFRCGFTHVILVSILVRKLHLKQQQTGLI